MSSETIWTISSLAFLTKTVVLWLYQPKGLYFDSAKPQFWALVN